MPQCCKAYAELSVCSLPARTRTATTTLTFRTINAVAFQVLVAEMQIEMSRGVDERDEGGCIESFVVQPGHTLARKECESQIKSNGQHKRNAELDDSN